MTTPITHTRESSIGSWAKKIRTSHHLTQQALADIAGVSVKEVDLLEHNLPIPLDIKRRLLKELFARKAKE
jgi:transcriptional regulator with XRE-family HTH domain